MPRPPLPCGLAALLLLAPFAPADTSAPKSVSLQEGQAALIVEGEKLEGGGVVLSLSGVLKVTLYVQGAERLEVDPLAPVYDAKVWNLLGSSPPKVTRLRQGQIAWVKQYEFAPLLPGGLPSPTVPLRYRDDQQRQWKRIAWEKPPRVEVRTSVTPDPSQLRGNLPIETLPPEPHWTCFLPWVLGPILVLAAAVIGVKLWRAYRRRRPSLPPAEWALRELDRLEKTDPPTAAAPDWFHTRLSQIIRRYLDDRFALRSSRQTTREFLSTVRTDDRLDEEQQRMLRELLEQCDLVKFARLVPSPEERAGAMSRARSLVESTRPEATVPTSRV